MYTIAVKIEGIESRRRSAGLLHIVIGFFMILKAAAYYRLINYANFFTMLPILAVGSFSLFYGFFRRKLDWSARYNYWLRLIQAVSFAALGIWLTSFGKSIDYIGVFLFALFTLMLLFSEKRIFEDTLITLDEKGVTIPGYYRNHIVAWEDVSQVVVREDFVTIFHIKQKYLQYQVRQDLSTLEVAKMNAFCKEQIEEKSSIVNRES
jgi:hypothetical protein